MCSVEEDSHTVTWEDECAADQDASLAHLNCPPRITAPPPPRPAPGSVQCLYSNKHFHKHHYVHTLTHMLTTQQLGGLGKSYSASIFSIWHWKPNSYKKHCDHIKNCLK